MLKKNTKREKKLIIIIQLCNVISLICVQNSLTDLIIIVISSIEIDAEFVATLA